MEYSLDGGNATFTKIMNPYSASSAASIVYFQIFFTPPAVILPLVKPDPALETKTWCVVVEAWTVWLSDCGLITL